MTDSQLKLFHQVCAKSGYRYDYEIAEKLGITPETLSRKLNGKSGWKLEEIELFNKVFSCPNKVSNLIFYSV